MTRERSEHEIIATMLRKIILRPAEKGSSTLMSERRETIFPLSHEQSETCFNYAMARKNRRRQRLHPLPMLGGAWGG